METICHKTCEQNEDVVKNFSSGNLIRVKVMVRKDVNFLLPVPHTPGSCTYLFWGMGISLSTFLAALTHDDIWQTDFTTKPLLKLKCKLQFFCGQIGHFWVLLCLCFQNESKCETIYMKMSSACSFIFMQINVIFIRMVLHLDLLWNRGTWKLGNGLLEKSWEFNV